MTSFEDIVPKPYKEFKDIFAKESFDELLDWKKWDNHCISILVFISYQLTLFRVSLVKGVALS